MPHDKSLFAKLRAADEAKSEVGRDKQALRLVRAKAELARAKLKLKRQAETQVAAPARCALGTDARAAERQECCEIYLGSPSTVAGHTWGNLPKRKIKRWVRLRCDRFTTQLTAARGEQHREHLDALIAAQIQASSAQKGGQPARRRFLVFTSAGDNSNVREWTSAQSRSYDVVVAYYGKNSFDTPVDGLFKRQDTKFPNLQWYMQNHALASYDAIAVWDDDLIVTPAGIEALFAEMMSTPEANIFSPCQQGGTITYGSLKKCSKNVNGMPRRVPFVEMNSCMFRPQILRDFMGVFDPVIKGSPPQAIAAGRKAEVANHAARALAVCRSLDDAPSPSAFDFHIIILTKNRPAALDRLLKSISRTEYGGDRICATVRIDGSHAETHRVASQWAWPNKNVVVGGGGGLRKAWLDAWQVQTGNAIVLEDDIELSTHWYAYLKGAWQAYGARHDIAGISLQRQTLIPRPPDAKSMEIVNNHVPFLYMLVGSIGFSPHPDRWREFLQWVKRHDLRTFDADVPGLITSGWYKALDKTTMWTQLFIRFCDEHRLYTLYSCTRELQGQLAHFGEQREAEIQRVCNEHYQAFIRSVREVLTMRQEVEALRRKLVNLNVEVQRTGQDELAAREALRRKRRTRELISAAARGITARLQLLRLATAVRQRLDAGELHAALSANADLGRAIEALRADATGSAGSAAGAGTAHAAAAMAVTAPARAAAAASTVAGGSARPDAVTQRVQQWRGVVQERARKEALAGYERWLDDARSRAAAVGRAALAMFAPPDTDSEGGGDDGEGGGSGDEEAEAELDALEGSLAPLYRVVHVCRRLSQHARLTAAGDAAGAAAGGITGDEGDAGGARDASAGRGAGEPASGSLAEFCAAYRRARAAQAEAAVWSVVATAAPAPATGRERATSHGNPFVAGARAASGGGAHPRSGWWDAGGGYESVLEQLLGFFTLECARCERQAAEQAVSGTGSVSVSGSGSGSGAGLDIAALRRFQSGTLRHCAALRHPRLRLPAEPLRRVLTVVVERRLRQLAERSARAAVARVFSAGGGGGGGDAGDGGDGGGDAGDGGDGGGGAGAGAGVAAGGSARRRESMRLQLQWQPMLVESEAEWDRRVAGFGLGHEIGGEEREAHKAQGGGGGAGAEARSLEIGGPAEPKPGSFPALVPFSAFVPFAARVMHEHTSMVMDFAAVAAGTGTGAGTGVGADTDAEAGAGAPDAAAVAGATGVAGAGSAGAGAAAGADALPAGAADIGGVVGGVATAVVSELQRALEAGLDAADADGAGGLPIAQVCQMAVDAVAMAAVVDGLEAAAMRRLVGRGAALAPARAAVGLAGARRVLAAVSDRATGAVTEMVVGKVDELLGGMAFVDFTPSEPRQTAHPFVDDLVSYLQVTAMSFTHLQRAARESVFFVSCSRIHGAMLAALEGEGGSGGGGGARQQLSELVLGSGGGGPRGRVNIFALHNMRLDLEALRAFADERGISQLSDCFDPLSQLLKLLLSHDWEQILEPAIRETTYAKLSDETLSAVLGKYKELSDLMGQGRRRAQQAGLPTVKRKAVDSILRKLRSAK
eukprot:g4561.t1